MREQGARLLFLGFAGGLVFRLGPRRRLPASLDRILLDRLLALVPRVLELRTASRRDRGVGPVHVLVPRTIEGRRGRIPGVRIDLTILERSIGTSDLFVLVFLVRGRYRLDLVERLCRRGRDRARHAHPRLEPPRHVTLEPCR
jgi:hypothetical protein